MAVHRSACMALNTHPDLVPDEAVQAAVRCAAQLVQALHVSIYAVTIPPMRSPLGGRVLDVSSMMRTVEERSRAEMRRLEEIVREAAGPGLTLEVALFDAELGAAFDAASRAARLHDLAVLPWSSRCESAQDMTQAVVFGSGRPVVVVPPAVGTAAPAHVAVAWDGGRTAARALGDALALLPEDCAVTVLTVVDEKPDATHGLGQPLAAALAGRGRRATARDIPLGGRSASEALQAAALEAGAAMLVMGGFGHSRFRDFILGGATKGVLHDLRLPTLMSH